MEKQAFKSTGYANPAYSGQFRLIPSIWSLIVEKQAFKSTGYANSANSGLFWLIPTYFGPFIGLRLTLSGPRVTRRNTLAVEG